MFEKLCSDSSIVVGCNIVHGGWIGLVGCDMELYFMGLFDMCAPEVERIGDYHDSWEFHDDVTGHV